ncbi:MAG: ATP-dependent DNA helicase RecG [Dehalococcoidia bacterium]|nr:ATP-dependent DNA helicase RecG [Dehalococcoidia bacterium]
MTAAPALPGRDAPPGRDALERLRKLLLLEQHRGYDNKAAIGGLDPLVRRLAAEIHRAIAGSPVREALRRTGLIDPQYAAMPPAQRPAWVQQALDCIATVPLPAPAAAPRGPPVSRPLSISDGEGRGEAPPAPAAPRPAPAVPPASVAPSASRSPGAPPSRPAPRPAAALLHAGQGLDTPVADLRGLGPYMTAKLDKLGVATVRDLLYYFPRRHIDFSRTEPIGRLEIGRDQTIIGTVFDVKVTQMGKRPRGAAEAVISDDTGNIRIVWFNQPYVAQSLRRGMRVAVSGRVGIYRGAKVFENPEYETAGDDRELVHTARLVPVYPVTEGVTSRRMRTLEKRVVDACATLVPEYLPPAMPARLGLLPVARAIAQAHFPESEQAKEAARRRLAFDELLLIQLGVLDRKRQWREAMPGHPLRAAPALLDPFYAQLPFPLTGAQRRAIAEVLADLARANPMSRLLQGDVGSGKTVVALAAALAAAAAGQQSALMAPTEILAEQHFRTVVRLLGAEPGATQDVITFRLPGWPRPVAVGLLTGGLTRKRKQQVIELTAAGDLDLLVGTHALFQKEVEFSQLALVIVDEQHRFGVMQRTELRQKGYNPHLLVMTATPIPRSLALTLYGDLDVSTLDEMPPGRQPVRTRWLEAGRRDTVYEFIRRQVAAGRQAFVIYPLIEESEKLEAAAARQEHERLSRDIFPTLRLGLLHGRMKSADKEKTMRAFRAGELDILVSTAVVEVGVDVPNATVMLVESADRFGLAQLHQFRGRVGRGEHPSYCMLISDAPSQEASERLRIMEQVHDGFALAEEDLKLRGPGEFFGTRQSGLPDLRMARLSDIALLNLARAEAEAIYRDDPALAKPEHANLATAVARSWAHRTLAPGEA